MNMSDNHRSQGSCVKIRVPQAACYIRFSDERSARSAYIADTARDEMMVFDYDAEGRVIGIELVGPGKPCQEA